MKPWIRVDVGRGVMILDSRGFGPKEVEKIRRIRKHLLQFRRGDVIDEVSLRRIPREEPPSHV